MDRKEIVILDGFAANPGDLSWAEIERLGHCVIYERSTPEEIIFRGKDAEIILLNKPNMTREILQQLPKLKFISVQATGYNMIDVHAAAELGITVSNVPAYSTTSVAQFVFSLILELCSAPALHSEAVRNGAWQKCPDFTFYLKSMHELAGMTLGIIGFGNIGLAVAEIAHAFGMKVIVFTRTRREHPFAEFVSAETVFRESDILSLHCPMTLETAGLVNRETLSMMKSSAILINTARGGLVQEDALYEALKTKRIAGAGLDVLSEEPPSKGNPLIGLENCLITPHIAWGPIEARRRLIHATAENIRAYLAGHPINVVNNF